MIPTVHWFTNPHEQRNDWLRFGLMRLHRGGLLHYHEHPLQACILFGFPSQVATHTHRHTSVIVVQDDSHTVRCIVDSEDSFFWMSPLIRDTDLYFCAGYNEAFFKGKRFELPYSWQEPHEVSFYQKKSLTLIRELGEFFPAVRPFVPIGPNLSRRTNHSFAANKFRNLYHKLSVRLALGPPWLVTWLDFETRYRRLTALRNAPIRFDVVLRDTCWGWPRHRHALHQHLQSLATRYTIHSRLDWNEPTECDGGDRYPLDPSMFPVETGHISDYEEMLASSRVAVFATGFHWGWRNIMTLSLMFGLPVYTDRLLLEPWFDMNAFRLFFNDDSSWSGLEPVLRGTSQEQWNQIKFHNQAVFDRFLAPERVATYFVETALAFRPAKC